MTDTQKTSAQAEEIVASMALDTGFNCGSVVKAFTNFGDWDGASALSSSAIGLQLEEVAARVKEGNLSDLETMLVSQAIALQSIFSMLAASSRAQNVKASEATLGLALKAQSASRATIAALAELKNPRQVAFVKQTNIAQNQQINHSSAGLPSLSHPATPEPAPLALTRPDDNMLLIPVISARREAVSTPARPREKNRDSAKQTVSLESKHGRA